MGPAVQAKGFGWSLGSWGGEDVGSATTTLSAGINVHKLQFIILVNDALFPIQVQTLCKLVMKKFLTQVFHQTN